MHDPKVNEQSETDLSEFKYYVENKPKNGFFGSASKFLVEHTKTSHSQKSDPRLSSPVHHSPLSSSSTQSRSYPQKVQGQDLRDNEPIIAKPEKQVQHSSILYTLSTIMAFLTVCFDIGLVCWIIHYSGVYTRSTLIQGLIGICVCTFVSIICAIAGHIRYSRQI